jgi:hypothetical protein
MPKLFLHVCHYTIKILSYSNNHSLPLKQKPMQRLFLLNFNEYYFTILKLLNILQGDWLWTHNYDQKHKKLDLDFRNKMY